MARPDVLRFRDDGPPAQFALGVRAIHGGANAPCAYCWPRLIDATFRDPVGLPCCASCGGHPERQTLMPRFLQASYRGEPTYAAAA